MGEYMTEYEIMTGPPRRQKSLARPSPVGCASCSNRRPGWFCSLGSAVLADLELVTSTISLPSQATLFTQGEDARCLYLICGGYLKLTAGRAQDRQMIVRVAGPGSMLGLYAALSLHGVYEVSAESLDGCPASSRRAGAIPLLPTRSQRSTNARGAVHLPGVSLCLAGRMSHRIS